MASVLAHLRLLFAVLFNRPLSVRLRQSGKATFFPREGLVLPVISGADDGDGDDDGGDEGDGEGDGGEGSGDEDGDEGDSDGDDGDDGDAGTKKSAEDYRRELRKSERRWKRTGERNKAEIEELRNKLKAREDADKSEQEKAVEKAKEEGRNEALTEAQKERRKDRLESAVIRAAGKRIEIGEGDEAKKVRFEDPEDAELYLQRKIAKGDLAEDDLFDDDGKVKGDVVAEALQEILEEKPRLAEDAGEDRASGKGKTAKGDADQGKGSPAKGEDEKSVDDLVKDMQVGNK